MKRWYAWCWWGMMAASVVCVMAAVGYSCQMAPITYTQRGLKSYEVGDFSQAAVWWEKAASDGDALAQYRLALMYDAGDKVSENPERAWELMHAAAARGYVDAVYALAVWYDVGYQENPNISKAVLLYEQAAASGHLNAMKSLSVIYGEKNTALFDKDKAQYWRDKVKTNSSIALP